MAKNESKKHEKKKADSKQLITELLSPETLEKKEFLWQEITAAMMEITRTQTDEAEDILVKLLEIEVPIRLAPNSEIPSTMSPESMLKSIAIQVLTKWTGQKHLNTFEKIYTKTRDTNLQRITKHVIEKLRSN